MVNKYTTELLQHIHFSRVNILPFYVSNMLYNRNNVIGKLSFTHRFITISSTLKKQVLYLMDSSTVLFKNLTLEWVTLILFTSTHFSTQSTETIFTSIFCAFLHVAKCPSLKTTWVTRLFKVFETCRSAQRVHL